MSYDTVFTVDNQTLLRELNLFDVQLERTADPAIKQNIEWVQASRALLGNEEEYQECDYVVKNSRETTKVKVFVASHCGVPPASINTSGHKQGDGELHFGYIYHDDDPNVKAVFFVIHPNSWGPYQKRFRTNTMYALLDAGINFLGEKAGGKIGVVVGAAIGTAIPIPVVGTAVGAVAGYCAGEATAAIVDGLAGDYLRYIG